MSVFSESVQLASVSMLDSLVTRSLNHLLIPFFTHSLTHTLTFFNKHNSNTTTYCYHLFVAVLAVFFSNSIKHTLCGSLLLLLSLSPSLLFRSVCVRRVSQFRALRLRARVLRVFVGRVCLSGCVSVCLCVPFCLCRCLCVVCVSVCACFRCWAGRPIASTRVRERLRRR